MTTDIWTILTAPPLKVSTRPKRRQYANDWRYLSGFFEWAVDRSVTALWAALRVFLWVSMVPLILSGRLFEGFAAFFWLGLITLLTLAPVAIRHLPENAKHRGYLILGLLLLAVIPAPMQALIALGVLTIAAAWSFALSVRDMWTAYIAVRDVSAAGKAKLRRAWAALQSRPPSFNLGPMMVMATATTEHRPQIAVHQEQGGSDSDDGDADHHVSKGSQNRDQPRQQGQKLSWDELYKQLQALRAEFYEIKAGEVSHAASQN